MFLAFSVVLCSGRLMHHLKEVEGMSLRTVEFCVFDEADRLFEMGFAVQLREILSKMNEARQVLSPDVSYVAACHMAACHTACHIAPCHITACRAAACHTAACQETEQKNSSAIGNTHCIILLALQHFRFALGTRCTEAWHEQQLQLTFALLHHQQAPTPDWFVPAHFGA